MEQSSESQSLKAFDMLRRAANEYNGAEYKFYVHGFVKFVREGNRMLLIEDIYVVPEFRNTPVSRMTLQSFELFMKKEGILMYYGRVFKASKSYKKRLETFKKWGMSTMEKDLYTLVNKQIEYEPVLIAGSIK